MKNKTIHRKVLLIGLFPPPITGQSVATQALYEALKERDIEVDKIALSNRTNVETVAGKLLKVIENLYVFLIYLWKIPFGKKIIYISPAASTFGFFRDYPAIALSHLFGQKIVAHFHIGDYKTFVESRPPFLKKCIIRTLLKVDKVILLAESIRPNFDISPLIKDKITIVQNGFPKTQDTLNTKSMDGKGGEIVLLFLSNMIQSKGYLTALEAVNILINEYKINTKILFCGQFMTSPDDIEPKTAKQAEEHFFKYIEDRKLGKNVSFLGVVSGEAKTKVFSEAHIFILPTEYYIEGLPISIIEALSYGMPIIATPHRGIPDLVIDGQTGFLISNINKAAFIAEKVKHLKENKDLFTAMSEAAKAHYSTYFTDKRHFDNIIAVLKELDEDL